MTTFLVLVTLTALASLCLSARRYFADSPPTLAPSPHVVAVGTPERVHDFCYDEGLRVTAVTFVCRLGDEEKLRGLRYPQVAYLNTRALDPELLAIVEEHLAVAQAVPYAYRRAVNQ